MRLVLKAFLGLMAVLVLLSSVALMAVMVVSAFVFRGGKRARELRTYAYCYFMNGQPDDVMELVSSHVDYWQGMQLDGYHGGPFADNSGGMIVFRVSSMNRASELVAGDPFVRGGVVGESWLKPWKKKQR